MLIHDFTSVFLPFKLSSSLSYTFNFLFSFRQSLRLFFHFRPFSTPSCTLRTFLCTIEPSAFTFVFTFVFEIEKHNDFASSLCSAPAASCLSISSRPVAITFFLLSTRFEVRSLHVPLHALLLLSVDTASRYTQTVFRPHVFAGRAIKFDLLISYFNTSLSNGADTLDCVTTYTKGHRATLLRTTFTVSSFHSLHPLHTHTHTQFLFSAPIFFILFLFFDVIFMIHILMVPIQPSPPSIHLLHAIKLF